MADHDSPTTGYPPLDERLERMREPLDHSASSTATDPAHAAQDASERVQTGRHAYTENATFTKQDIPAPSTKAVTWADDTADSQWTTLNQANRDFYADDNTDIRSEQHKQDHVNDTQAWGRQIGLTDTEIHRAAHFVLDAERGFMNNHGSEAVILAALTLAANEGHDQRTTQPKEIRPENPLSDQAPELAETYRTIRSALDVDPASVTNCRDHLRDVSLYDNP